MSFLDIIYPRYCLGCRQKGSYLCETCTNSLRRTFHPPPKNIDNLITLWKYEGAARKTILALKYRFASEIAGELIPLAAAELKKYQLPTNSILAPIPLHKKRENWRGFNQSSIIAKELAKILKLPYSGEILTRKIHATPQAQLKKEKRLRNIRGKYAVNDAAKQVILTEVEGSRPTIILFDDVVTTGATFSEAASVLKASGAKSIWAIALAG